MMIIFSTQGVPRLPTEVVSSQSGPFFPVKMPHMLQLLGDLVSRPPTGALPMDPTGGLPSPNPLLCTSVSKSGLRPCLLIILFKAFITVITGLICTVSATCSRSNAFAVCPFCLWVNTVIRWRICTVMFTCGWAWPARWPIRRILGFWGSKVHKNS